MNSVKTKRGWRKPAPFFYWARSQDRCKLHSMYDVFLLAYDEPSADISFRYLRDLCPIARLVSGIKGIQAAHAHCATLSKTTHFFVVDADNQIDDESAFTYRVPPYDASYVHLWYARNPLNSLSYGWGGLKLFPKALFVGIPEMGLDMTTSFPLKIIPNVVSTTHFNTSPYATWRSAFRECVKLTLAEQTMETRERLYTWKNVARGMHADWCLKGARAGAQYGEAHRGNSDALALINDFDWLKSAFSKSC